MARFLVYCLCLIFVNAHLSLAMAESEEKPVIAEAPTARKLGRRNTLQGKIAASRVSPAEAPKAEESPEFSREVSASGEETGPVAQEQVMKINHHHRSIDKSVAGGGVILGALAITFLVAVFCYIRATRRNTVEPGSPTTNLSIGRKNAEPGSPTNSSK